MIKQYPKKETDFIFIEFCKQQRCPTCELYEEEDRGIHITKRNCDNRYNINMVCEKKYNEIRLEKLKEILS